VRDLYARALGARECSLPAAFRVPAPAPRGKFGVVREELPGHAAGFWGSPGGECPDATHGGSWLNASKPEAGPSDGAVYKQESVCVCVCV